MRLSRVYTAEGIVLKRRNVGEADRILTVFTKRFGKIRVIAKGVRRITSRRAGHIEVFSRVILTLHSYKNMDIVSEAQAITRGMLLERDAARLGYAYCMCELVDQLLADHQEHEDVFMLLRDALEKLQTADNQGVSQDVVSNFVHHLLWRLGFLSFSRRLLRSEMRSYIEQITERKLRAWPVLTV
ncbi:DNA repair protein RecO [Candidatus Gottesmanbacteria bacterium RIFCSPLOWO2_01_FULL_46_9]|uniref:DNA repair protein RecO n=1 Tax=Candidatus Gottesmanbacteria bacterium RIFCSPLOWO2_01_FULL_46_9 TaxID=1798394 RepID=A0A1F6B370_9BACT|nr:MAG: DNA repair protein RecO [Candidatus Gottesmanbacteria bacterium RIFCSPLOWO2_01_FULL_46_9]